MPHITLTCVACASCIHSGSKKNSWKFTENSFLVFTYFVLCAVGRYFFFCNFTHFLVVLSLGSKNAFSSFFLWKGVHSVLTYASYYFFAFQSWIVTIHNTYDVAKFWFRYEIQYNMQKIGSYCNIKVLIIIGFLY